MRRRLVAIISLTIASALAPLAARAQTRGGFEITPRLGIYVPMNDRGAAAPSTGPWHLRLDRAEPALSLEIALEAPWPGAGFSTRLVGLRTLPSQASGFFDCHPGLACPSVLLPSSADVTVLAAVANLLFSPLQPRSRVRPYAIAGAGFKRHDYAWPAAAVLVAGGDHTETNIALNAGIGVALNVFGLALRAEVSDYWSPRGDGADQTRIIALNSGTDPISDVLRSRAQHDIAFSIGWRALRF